MDFLADVFATLGREANAEPLVVVVADRTGEPVLALPFALRRRGPFRVVEGIDFDVCDYWMPLRSARAHWTDAEMTSVWAAVRAALPPADAITLKKVPLSVHGTPHPFAAWSRLKPMGAIATRVPLVGEDGAPVALSSLSVVKETRQKLRKIEKSGLTVVELAADPATVRSRLDDMFRQRRERFSRKGRPDLLSRETAETFYRTRAEKGLVDGSVRVFSLRVGDESLAVVYGLSHGGVFTILIPTMTSDERWRTASPGLVLFVKTMEWAQANGHHLFDLSVGALAYKARFGGIETDLAELQQALTLKGEALVLAEAGRRGLRRFGRSHPAADQWMRDPTGMLDAAWRRRVGGASGSTPRT
ncbi:GNAT family N-acetyltransferase [Chthonobacter rhizosphaerae]|uniref:GNAT family N-acetyltransferase n=1 Tax=Chthonobacter rhizosphaerae TaxID=2735553 RepID=UPI0015EF1290|nr:GNAT family N-acetyltransferase [Chthonobacter rhizosphaerae]